MTRVTTPVRASTPVSKEALPDVALRFDRRISAALLAAVEDGPLAGLLAIRQEDPAIRDLQLRANPWDNDCWVSLYCGLSTVLDVHERGGFFWLQTHPSYSAAGFDPTWRTERLTEEELAQIWPHVEAFIRGVIPIVKKMFTAKEGRVHGVMCSGSPTQYQVINRESSPSFPKGSGDKGGAKEKFMRSIAERVWDALAAAGSSVADQAWWKPGKAIGPSPDLIAVNDSGQLLVIEAKWAGDSQRTPWGPPQLAFYAELWAHALATDRTAHALLTAMLAQRASLGLSATWPMKRPIRIVPVLAIGNGDPTREVLRRTLTVQQALDEHFNPNPRVRPTEVWLIDDATGDPRSRLNRR